jgi:ferric-dicitrate binding protein FerR (iron transport regulator)
VAALQEKRMSRKHTNAAVPDAVCCFLRFRIKNQAALSPDESADWARWSADDTHLDEFCRVKQLWQKLEVLSAIVRPTQEDLAADEYDPSLSVRDWLVRGNAKKRPP